MRVLVPALALLALALPEAASACSVCIGGQTDETRYAFIWTTGFLSLLPVSMIGGAAWWLRRRARELALREAERSEPAIGAERRASAS